MSVATTVMGWITGHYSQQVFRATVTGTSGNQVYIQRLGQAAADVASYPKLASYTPVTVGDEVEVVSVGGTPVVQGKITR